jgi:hypothetical protein
MANIAIENFMEVTPHRSVGPPYTVYNIYVDGKYRCAKRYSEFESLHKAVRGVIAKAVSCLAFIYFFLPAAEKPLPMVHISDISGQENEWLAEQYPLECRARRSPQRA